MSHRSIFGSIGRLLGDFDRARDASAIYDRLSQMSDERLAVQGLKRTDIAGIVLSRVINEA